MKVPVYKITKLVRPETEYTYGEIIEPIEGKPLWTQEYRRGDEVVFASLMELPRVYMKLKEVRKQRAKDGYKFVDDYIVYKERVTK